METTNNDGFNPLDALGSEYGKINAPNIDAKGLSAFEGDEIAPHQINFPTPSVPSMPSMPRQNAVNPVNRPQPIQKGNFEQTKNEFKDKLRNILKANQDNNEYSKVYSYDASPDSNAFYKRYQAYGQKKFDEIGFSPLRDNEALFNSRTTMWDDVNRMMVNSYFPLWNLGFVSGPKSLNRMLHGDFTDTDLGEAEAYEQAAAIGQSSKGGVLGFANNTLMNFGYSQGIMSEAIVEEAALFLGTVLTGGGGAPVLAGRTGMNIFRIGKGFKNLFTAGETAAKLQKTINAVSTIKGARQFWSGVKGVGKALNPLGNTIDAIQTIKKADNLSDLAALSKTAGGFYRDIRNINMALSEARLEAGMVQNHIYDDLYNKYYNKFGKAPDNDTQYKMMKQAKKGSLNTLYWNAGLIYGSNIVTFPNIVGKKGGFANFAAGTVKELGEVSGGKFGKLGQIIYDKATKKFVFEKNNLINWGKGLARNPINKSLTNTIGYFKANFAEGIQENLQEVIGNANQRYYVDTFNSKALQAHNYSKSVSKYDYFSDEFGNQFTAQGLETFASGLLMGTFAHPVNKMYDYLGIGFNKMFKKEAYEKLKNKKLEITRDLVSNLNDIDVKDFLDSKMFNYGQQELIARVIANGTTKQGVDASHEALLNQMDLLVRNGGFESYVEKLKDLQQLTPEEFEDNVKTVPKGEGLKYQNKINDTIQKMDRINNRYKVYREKFQNPVTEENLPPKGTVEYNNAVILTNAWDEAIKNAVFFNESFEDTMLRKKQILEKFVSQKPLESLTQRDAEIIFDHDKLRNEVGLLKNEIENLNSLNDPLSKEEAKKKQQKLDAMQKLGEETVNFTNFFNRHERINEIRNILQKEKGEEPVTDEEITKVMNEYFGEDNEENQVNKINSYETAFKNYLKSVANVNKDYVFDENIDKAFELLMDHHTLDSESRALIKGVNLLHDPASFLDIVERNQKWMKELYDKRKDYYEKMIHDQFDVVVDNALLNELAKRQIYIDIDQFIAWKNEGIPPSEFYDHARKIVIPEGTPEYEEYYQLLENAAELKNQKSEIVPTSLDENLKKDLDKLDEEKEKEIEKVPKIESKVSIKKIQPNDEGNITFDLIEDQLEPNSYVDININGEDITFFMDENEDIHENDITGDIISGKTVNIKIDSATTYRLDEVPNPKYVEEIEAKYTKLKNDRIKEYTEEVEKLEEEDNNKVNTILEPVTTDNTLEKILGRSPILFNSLKEEFKKKVLDKLDSEEFVNMNSDQERNLFENFIKSDVAAKQLIDDFNKAQKVQSARKGPQDKQDFEFVYQGKKMNTADLSLEELEKMKKRFDVLINTINKKDDITTDDETKKSLYQIVSKDLEKLIAVRNKANNKVESEITADEYDEFIDKGIVKAERIRMIAEKIKNGTELTQQEQEIFQDKTSEINEELRKMNEKDVSKANLSNIKAQNTDIERRSRIADIITSQLELGVELPKILETLAEQGYVEKINNSAFFKQANSRDAIVFNIDGAIVPIYRSSKGTSSKTKGEWYPFFFNGGDWLVKAGASTYKDGYNNPIIKQILDSLNKNYKYDKPIAKVEGNNEELLALLPLEGFDIDTSFENNSGIYDFQNYVAIALILKDWQSKLGNIDVSDYQDYLSGTMESLIKTNPEFKSEIEKAFKIASDIFEEIAALESKVKETKDVIPEDPQSSDDVNSPTQNPSARKVEVIDDAKRYTIDDLKADLAILEINDVIAKINTKVIDKAVSFEDLQVMSELVKAKQQEIKSGRLKIDPNHLALDTHLIAKQSIFDGKKLLISENDTAVVKAVDIPSKQVLIVSLGNTNEIQISFDKLNEMFILKEMLMDSTKPISEPITNEEKENIAVSSDLADILLNASSDLDKLENTVSKKNTDTLDSELLDDLNC